MADGYLCRDCSRVVSATKNNRYRTHRDRDGQTNCVASSAPIPDDLLEQAPSSTKSAGVPEEGKDFAKCPQCGRNVTLTRLGYFPQHDTTLYGGEQCSTTGVRAFHAGKKTDLPLPGDSLPEKGVDRAVRPKVSNELELHRERLGKPMKELEAAPVPTPAGTAPATVTPTAEAAAPALEGASSPSPTTKPGSELPPDWPPEPPGYEEEGENGEPILPYAVRPSESGSGPAPTTPSPVSTSTSESSEKSSEPSEPSGTSSSSSGSLPVFKLGRKLSELISQPYSPFLQPGEYKEPPLVILQPPEWNGTPKAEPLDGYDLALATRIKETFYAYDNRKSSDNRSAQTTLGPSEIGTPCDRRLAMSLLNVPPVNPGGDGWAAFVGTCGHVGMGEMLTFADAGTGRYAVEMPLTFPSAFVPRGTTDALDRRDGTIIDWKFMGAYSLKKFKLEGPSDTYRVQAHTYGLGAQLNGEKVKRVAIVGLPRAGSSLEEMHVWSEPFDRKIGEAALKRVEGIAERVEPVIDGLSAQTPMGAAAGFDTASDCRYCPFFLKGDKEMRRGCPGV